jgi:hypothetical protein
LSFEDLLAGNGDDFAKPAFKCDFGSGLDGRAGGLIELAFIACCHRDDERLV